MWHCGCGVAFMRALWQAFRYQKFELDDDDLCMIVRCEIDAAFEGKEGKKDIKYMTVKALNEWDPVASGVNWRQKLGNNLKSLLYSFLT